MPNKKYGDRISRIWLTGTLVFLVVMAALSMLLTFALADNDFVHQFGTHHLDTPGDGWLTTYADLDNDPTTGAWVGGTWYPNETQISILCLSGRLTTNPVFPASYPGDIYFSFEDMPQGDPGWETQKGEFIVRFIDVTAPGYVWDDNATWQPRLVTDATFSLNPDLWTWNYVEYYGPNDPNNVLNPSPYIRATAYQGFGGDTMVDSTLSHLNLHSDVGFSEIHFGTDYWDNYVENLRVYVNSDTQTEVWVDDDYCDECGNDGHTWGLDAFDKIQDGIDAVASPGGMVHVADGIYTGIGNKNLDFGGKAITVQSENGAENCIIDCENSGRGFYFHNGEGLDSVVDGFTITNGSDTSGGGMYIQYSSNPTVTNCIFFHNTATSNGGGIYTSVSSPTVTNCTFSDNDADYGGGMYNIGLGGGNSRPRVTNCTFYSNSATNGGAVYNSFSSPRVTNCILWSDTPNEVHNISSNPTITYCDVDQDGYAGINGNIRTNPAWVNPSGGDFHLLPSSPCIDAGDNSAPSLPATDFEGDDRIINSIVDMGADESTTPTVQKGDFNGDDCVSLSDFVAFTGVYDSCIGEPNYNPIGDFDDSGCIGLSDFVQFTGVYDTCY